ncbi:hypothetical protein J3A83DRAFT_4199541 [Scleroderma citrinum]
MLNSPPPPGDLEVYPTLPSISHASLRLWWAAPNTIIIVIPFLGVIAIHLIQIFTASQPIVLTICFMVILPSVMRLFHVVRPFSDQAGLHEVNFASTQVPWVSHWRRHCSTHPTTFDLSLIQVMLS